MKVTHKMVKYWLSNTGEAETIKDYKDIANGEYTADLLKQDIIQTWANRGYDDDAEEKTIGVEE